MYSAAKISVSRSANRDFEQLQYLSSRLKPTIDNEIPLVKDLGDFHLARIPVVESEGIKTSRLNNSLLACVLSGIRRFAYLFRCENLQAPFQFFV